MLSVCASCVPSVFSVFSVCARACVRDVCVRVYVCSCLGGEKNKLVHLPTFGQGVFSLVVGDVM